MFVDSHVNLHGEKFSDDLDAVVTRAKDANVTTMLTICCALSEFDSVYNVAASYDNMWASVGTHPHEAKTNPDITPEDLIKKAALPRVVGIGETGLDFHYNFSDREAQFHNFLAHIEAARKTRLPLIIHSRNADDEMGDILEQEMKKGEFPALLHCYTSGKRLAEQGLDMGLYFSFSGIITFKNANDVREIVTMIPDDKLLIETDCPYLAPVPYRGRRCEPHMVSEVASKLAEIRKWSIEETASKTTDNFFKLFAKAERKKQ